MGEKSIKLRAHAKINLTLRILGKRADGFHEIETLMVPLDLADDLELSPLAPGDSVLECVDGGIPDGEDNLAVRALRLVEEKAGRPLDVKIRLEKRIPVGAGLGGGSSDAAAVLEGVNRFCDLGLTFEDLQNLAGVLGSDVPFFLYGGPCWCRGRGEHVSAAGAGGGLDLVLVKPAFPVATPEAYGLWERAREIPGLRYDPQMFAWGELVNDLERPVFQKHLHLAQLRKWLERRPEVSGARLSGSGSTVFGILRDGAGVEELKREARGLFGESLWMQRATTLLTRP